MRATWILLCALALAAPVPAGADGGRVEINQTSVEAAGGFPFLISEAGNYVLTSDLIVPADTRAIVVNANDVVLDLGGFRILGPHVCNVASCATGIVNGISPDGGRGRRVTVRNGSIRGFSGICLLLLQDAHVTDMLVSACGNLGIQLSAGSLLRDTRVSETGRQGVVLIQDVGFSDNVVRRSGLALDSPTISGGMATGGNVCDDGACSAQGRARYYLTQGLFTGSQALGACDPGFHMASIWEIFDVSNLDYDTTRGQPSQDAGEGPPAVTFDGWVRTGNFGAGTHPVTASLEIGFVNCNAWGTSSGSQRGTRARLGSNWSGANPQEVSPWSGSAVACSSSGRVWCVSD